MTHDELRQTLEAGQDAALTALYARYAQRGVNYAFGFLGDRSDSEDVVHDAFCRLMAPGQRHRLERPEDEVAAVFLTAVRNLAIDLLRRRKRHHHEQLHETGAEEERAPEFDETEVRGLVERLPKEWAEALRLRVDGKLSYARIAEVLECTVPQVRTRIYRARNQLAKELQRRGIPVHR